VNLPEGFVLENQQQAPQQAANLPQGFVLEQQPQNMNELWGNTPRGPVQAQNNRNTPLDAEVTNILAREAQNADPKLAKNARVEQHIRRIEDNGGNAAADVFTQGLTYGLSDELGAALQTLRGSGNYAELLDAERERLSRVKKDSPVLSTATEIAGAIANPLSRLGWAASAADRGQRFVRGAIEGGALAGLYGFNQGEDGLANRATNAATSLLVAAPIGGAINAALPAIRGAVSQTAGSQVAEAGERLGVALPRAVTSDSAATQQTAKIAANVPWAGQPLRQASTQAIEQLDDASRNVAQGYGNPAANAATAGQTLRSGIEQYIGPTTKGRVSKLYDEVDNLVDPTLTGPMTNTQQALSAINARRQLSARGESPAGELLGPALSRHGITYEGLKDLRTVFGEKLNPTLIAKNLEEGERKALYRALTLDLRHTTLLAGGQEALKKWERANTYNSLVMDRRENLNRLLKVNSDEQLFDRVLGAAQNKGRADVQLLSQARKALPADEWNEVAAGVINRMGRDAEGNLTPDRFVTAYGQLSPAGKSLLFRSTGQSNLAGALDDIALVSSRFKQMNQYANPSGTAQSVIGGATGFGAIADPVTTLTSMMTARVMSGLLAKPQSAQSIAKWSNAYYNAVAKPTRATLQALQNANRSFADDIGRQLGVPQHAEALFRQLNAVVNATADGQPQER